VECVSGPHVLVDYGGEPGIPSWMHATS